MPHVDGRGVKHAGGGGGRGGGGLEGGEGGEDVELFGDKGIGAGEVEGVHV